MESNPLLDLYASHAAGLRSINQELTDADNYDGPFLMDMPTEAFRCSTHRLLIIGQETNGWIGHRRINDEAGLRENMVLYRQFDFGRTYNTTWFRYARSIAGQVVGEATYMWTNIHKYGRASGSGTPSAVVRQAEVCHFNVLAEEIRLIDPTCVIFMSGPRYDTFIRDRLPDAELFPVDGFTYRQIARVSSASLPQVSYRIYHPGYGNRVKLLYDRTIEVVVQAYKRSAQGDAGSPSIGEAC